MNMRSLRGRMTMCLTLVGAVGWAAGCDAAAITVPTASPGTSGGQAAATGGSAGTAENGGARAGSATGGGAGAAAACGNLGEPCCGGGACTAPASYCRANADGWNICSPCGGPGEACCAVMASQRSCLQGGCCINDVCVANGSSCGDQEGLCQAGACENCGGDGQACCAGTCPDWYECAGGDGGQVCRHCGADGESCCSNGPSPRCEVSAVCVNSSGALSSECHATCGAVGQPCCTVTGNGNDGCSETGLNCENGACVETNGAGGAGGL